MLDAIANYTIIVRLLASGGSSLPKSTVLYVKSPIAVLAFRPSYGTCTLLRMDRVFVESLLFVVTGYITFFLKAKVVANTAEY